MKCTNTPVLLWLYSAKLILQRLPSFPHITTSPTQAGSDESELWDTTTMSDGLPWILGYCGDELLTTSEGHLFLLTSSEGKIANIQQTNKSNSDKHFSDH